MKVDRRAKGYLVTATVLVMLAVVTAGVVPDASLIFAVFGMGMIGMAVGRLEAMNS